jgi:hypothetical protein
MIYGGLQVAKDREPAVPASVRPPAVDTIIRERPRPSRPTFRVSGLRSRYAAPGVVEVWGTTRAPDGSTVRAYAEVNGRRSRLGDAPAAQRRFYLRAKVPARLRGVTIRVSARVIR